MNFECRFTVPDNVMFEELSDNIVIVNIETSNYYSLNQVGTHLWKLLANGLNLEQAIPILLTEFAVEESQLRQDCLSILANLCSAGLLCPQSPQAD